MFLRFVRRRRALLGFAALSAAVMFAATACGGGSAPSPTATPTPTKAATQAPTATVQLVPTPTVARQSTPSTSGSPGTFPIPYAGNVPRNETLIYVTSGTTITTPDNQNPYSVAGLGRVRAILDRTVYSFLYLYDFSTGQEIPWLAKSYKIASDNMSVSVVLRDGITWSDGKPFTCSDIKFTLDLLKANPELTFSSDMQTWVKDVVVTDPTHCTIELNKPNPRFFFEYFESNSEIQIAILPQHIWQGKDPTKFTNFDLSKGYPIGTGPYALTYESPQKLVFDRNDNWWAYKTGFQPLPAPKRVELIPYGSSSEQLVALGINNQVDVLGGIPPGDFTAARKKNPDLHTWNDAGPVYGAPDGCVYTLGLNDMAGPFANVDVRQAVDHAINRTQLVNLAYQGTTDTVVLPFSRYGGLTPYWNAAKSLIQKYNPDDPSQALVAQYMQKAGYTKDSSGFWAKDGKEIQTKLDVAAWLSPMGPVLLKQLRDAGFNLTLNQDPGPDTVFFDRVRTGKSDIWVIVHCGSYSEPFGTLQHFMSRFSAPIGTTDSYIWANSRYQNPEYDKILTQMEGMVPSSDNPTYMNLSMQAVNIFLRDMPEIPLAEERWVRTVNEHYWTGFADKANPYAAPYEIWSAYLLDELKIKPTGAK